MTIQQRTFTQPADVTSYWIELVKADLAYHIDDVPADVFGDDHDDIVALTANHNALWDYAVTANVEPWDLIDITLTNVDGE